ncbi:T9SS type A sorting domain-containing protein [Tenacibaculum agarivorans]|uniref:T9SS type A sorting domain-containing protein n=1 Tax=Tenacibaculum agarivorans TaxID=1908389 RepID=UPI00094B7DEA|nr:T9SS type A sorting domain-containing protein [Tenacibaculum agarivorans]
MKTKEFLKLFFLFFCATNSAQQVKFITADITISITESPVINEENIEFIYPNEFVFYRNDNVFTKVHLDNQSTLKKMRYFRLELITASIDSLPPNIRCKNFTDNLGATAPVIIPPIGDDDDERNNLTKTKVNDIIALDYPFVVKKMLWLKSPINKFKFNLLAYDTKERYLNDEYGVDGKSVACAVIDIKVLDEDRPIIKENKIQTIYPNPFTNRINVITNTENKTKPKMKLFNGLGRQFPIHFLENSEDKNLYRLDTSGLKRGIYFFHIQLDKEIYTKTIRKE